MSDLTLVEEVVAFGDDGRLSGILTLPRVLSEGPEKPVFVFLNSGFLHRVGPNRLYVRLARTLSTLGFASLRIDLSGKGDSPQRRGMTIRQCESMDHDDIVRGLESRLGSVTLVLAGLCSGADDAVRSSLRDARVVGLLLFDPICFPGKFFKLRALMLKYAHVRRYQGWIRSRLKKKHLRRERPMEIDPLSIRDAPTYEEMRSAFAAIHERKGRVLSIFSSWATTYYNGAGQLESVLNLTEYRYFCAELFWRDVEHTYTLDVHRRRLIDTVNNWAKDYVLP